MPAAMHLTVLSSLLAVTVCTGTTTSSAGTTTSSPAEQITKITTTAANPVTFDFPLSTAVPTKSTQQSTMSTNQTTTAVPSGKVSTSPPPSISTQTPSRTEGPQTSSPPKNATTNQTSKRTVPPGSTATPASTAPNITTATTVNTTVLGPLEEWSKDDLAANPGLVAILCIFCIVFVLGLVVATVKCIELPRSNFERLENVPLGKVTEESPFAHYSK
ncbi:threonine-rich protein-like [Labrus mixtus]|uniref:threonine-rich protein-like n=1 Tax=Labrus mixtus TaxID=508554 RepID=UPI0029C06ECE|nr:threonine-rich protein-like [Labrus mixtus]